ncbi:MAG: zinc ribbon domain-containing protein [Oscillospiraceae bacterium]|nr:zinc ribbon domain-containing protein [Oscillospiraceae bacterium]
MCENCGKHYKRVTKNGKKGWNCSTYQQQGKNICHTKQIPEEELYRLSKEVLGIDEFNSDMFENKITAITATKDNSLIFTLTNGETIVKRWLPRNRSNSWTDEMREKARQRMVERRAQNGNI